MPKSDFKKVAHHRCSPVNLLHIFRATFSRNSSGRLLLNFGFPVLCDLAVIDVQSSGFLTSSRGTF